jgi:hypothetical protein
MTDLIERHWWALRAAWTEYRAQVRYIKHAVQTDAAREKATA